MFVDSNAFKSAYPLIKAKPVLEMKHNVPDTRHGENRMDRAMLGNLFFCGFCALRSKGWGDRRKEGFAMLEP